jgi:DNA polymerase III delta prime subunit
VSSPLLLLVGPTAVGKTSVSLPLAETVGGEIVSVDSRQIYERIDVGTAKPSPAERERIRHHLIDQRPLDREISAGSYAELAEDRIAAVIFFRDPLTAQPHEPDVSALLRICDVHRVPLATNLGTALAIVSWLEAGP